MQTPQGVWTAVAGLPHLSKDDVIVIVSRLEEELLHRQRMVVRRFPNRSTSAPAVMTYGRLCRSRSRRS